MAAFGADESIYSHKTSTILDQEQVSFMHLTNMNDPENESDDAFSDGIDVVVEYPKDDLTKYSEGRGLNKVRMPKPNYFSENDLNQVEDASESEAEYDLEA